MGEHYLEPSSFDAPVELVIFSAPAPEAVGHPVALTKTGRVICPILPGMLFGLLLGGPKPKWGQDRPPFLLLL